MEMRVLDPPAALAGMVVALWTLRGRVSRPYVGLPKPFAELIVSLSGRHLWQESASGAAIAFEDGWLTPVQAGPRIASTDGELHLVGARLHLSTCVSLFGPDCVREPWIPIPLFALVGRDAVVLRDQLLAQPDATNRMLVLAEWIVGRLHPVPTCPLPDLQRLHRLRWRVDAFAESLGVSPRGLHKRFVKDFGIGPKLWLQLSRFDALLRLRSRERSLAETAQFLGFADQSHLNAEFRRFTGTSPGGYEAARGSAPTPKAAPHFVPHRW